jgi:hypothetical protein
MLSLSRLCASFAVSAVFAGGSLFAQCLGPDNLNGPCCGLTVANLPAFPPQSLPGEGICWTGCNVSGQVCNKVDLAMPVQINCAEYVVDMKVTDCAGMPLLGGKLHLDYTRTWDEFPFPGATLQVWRFVVKADIGKTSTLPATCPVPTCTNAWPTAFYYGYLDYAFNCATGGWQSSLVLFHGCDKFQHDPLLSDKPGVYHPTTSYALVAPTTTANPFVPAILPATGSPVLAEAIRDASDPATLACMNEEAIVQGFIQPLGAACACPFAFFPPQVTARHMEATSFCGSSYRSINVFGNFPWFEVMTTSIGTWTTGANYPGPEAAWVDEGVFLHFQGCVATGPVPYAEIKYGASTAQGYPAGAGGILVGKMTDMVDNYSVKLGNPITLPMVGSAKPTHHLLYTSAP